MNTVQLREKLAVIRWRLEGMACHCNGGRQLPCDRCQCLIEIQEVIDEQPTPVYTGKRPPPADAGKETT